MIGGIYRYHVFPEPIDPALVNSIYRRAYGIFGEDVAKDLAKKYQWFPYTAEMLLTSANAALTHWLNNKKSRGYLHESGDLIRSAGVAIYHRTPVTKGRDIVYQFAAEKGELVSGFGMGDRAWKQFQGRSVTNEHSYPYTYTYVTKEGRIRHKTEYRLRKRHSENPVSRFREAAGDYKTHLEDRKGGWEVVFMVTMPYAVRLEKGYGKSVLIGAMNWIDNEFLRRAGMSPIKSNWIYQSAANE